jgi:hypothetical protein
MFDKATHLLSNNSGPDSYSVVIHTSMPALPGNEMLRRHPQRTPVESCASSTSFLAALP